MAKHALLSYLTAPLGLPSDYHGAFSNAGIVRSWVDVLDEMGYHVTVVDWESKPRLPRHYDLFVGHGGRNWSHLADQLPPACAKIYFAAGTPWRLHNEREVRRFGDLALRRGANLPYDRLITAGEDIAYEDADGLICLGNLDAEAEYRQVHPRVRSVQCGVYPDGHFDPAKKDFKAGRSRFLFFSGYGNVHKGLDLLLEAFAKLPKAELYIATNLEPDFALAYGRELRLPNIHVEGWVPLKGPRFYELVDRCDYVILPSCAEGQPGSVLECMNQGLVPLITEACHIDVYPAGEILDCDAPDLERSLRQQIATMGDIFPEIIRIWAVENFRVAHTTHSPEAFRHGLRQAVEEILASMEAHHA